MELKSFIKEIFDLLEAGNYEAHYININGKLFNQLFELLKMYKNKNYPNIKNFIDKTNLEEKLKDLVKIRTERYKMNKKRFEEKENMVINAIKTYEKLKNNFLNKIY